MHLANVSESIEARTIKTALDFVIFFSNADSKSPRRTARQKTVFPWCPRHSILGGEKLGEGMWGWGEENRQETERSRLQALMEPDSSISRLFDFFIRYDSTFGRNGQSNETVLAKFSKRDWVYQAAAAVSAGARPRHRRLESAVSHSPGNHGKGS